MPYNNISAAIAPADLAAIKTKLTEVKNLLPFVVNLTPEERKTILKMGDGSLAFVSKAAEYAEANPTLVPPFLNVTEFKKDFQLAKDLIGILQLLNQLCERVDDTRLAVGSESFLEALTFYNTAKQAAKANVPGADTVYEDLKARFLQTSTVPEVPIEG